MSQEPNAGAMPAAGGATPPQTDPAAAGDPAATTPPTPPATGDEGLGDAGQRAIRAERERAKAAERERDELKQRLEALEGASKSDHEKAIDAAKKTAAAEAKTGYDARIRRSEVKAALAAQGINPAELDLAAMAGEFNRLKVTDDGDVEGLAETVKAFKASHPSLFTKAGLPSADVGAGAGSAPGLTLDAIKRMTPAEYEKRRAEVMTFLSNQR